MNVDAEEDLGNVDPALNGALCAVMRWGDRTVVVREAQAEDDGPEAFVGVYSDGELGAYVVTSDLAGLGVARGLWVFAGICGATGTVVEATCGGRNLPVWLMGHVWVCAVSGEPGDALDIVLKHGDRESRHALTLARQAESRELP